jgi:hypothetical protein
MIDIFYPIAIEPQPTETTCGPTCLSAIYKFLKKPIPIKETISEVRYLDTGGTMGEALGINALENKLNVTIYTHNLHVFDPTWFRLSKENLIKKLKKQAKAPKTLKIKKSSKLYIDFLRMGGKVKFEHLTPQFLHQLLIDKGPVIVGLSSTYLYMCERERNDDNEYDDVLGSPQGHFVVLAGMKKKGAQVEIYDPLDDNPISQSNNYSVDTTLFINSILIGAITYDANIVVIED